MAADEFIEVARSDAGRRELVSHSGNRLQVRVVCVLGSAVVQFYDNCSRTRTSAKQHVEGIEAHLPFGSRNHVLRYLRPRYGVHFHRSTTTSN